MLSSFLTREREGRIVDVNSDAVTSLDATGALLWVQYKAYDDAFDIDAVPSSPRFI